MRTKAIVVHITQALAEGALIAVLVVGLAVKGFVGTAALVLVAAFLGWFSYLSWPAVELPGRLLRGSVIIAVLALAVSQAVR